MAKCPNLLMSQNETTSCAVVGLGRLGVALARALVAAGQPVAAVASRNSAVAQSLALELGTRVQALPDLPQHCQVIFVTVPDGQLAQVATQLPVGERHLVVHCSGALAPGVLDPEGKQRAALGGFHPLQSFPPDSGPERFAGIAIGIEAPSPWLARLQGLAQQLGARPLLLAGVDRARYHAAAVFASNYLVALLQGATEVWAAAGLREEDALAALLPLTRGALGAVETQPLRAALTGPVARGDVGTVERHLAVLGDLPALQRCYRQLGERLLALGCPADPQAHSALRALLADPSGE